MSAIEILEDSLYGLITDLTGLPIRFKNASSQKINDQHIMLHFKEFEEVGWYHNEGYNIDGDEVTAKEYEAVVDIACHGGIRTSGVLQKILHAMSTPSGLYYKYFDNNTISFLRASSVTRRDWPVSKVQFEERSQITIVFSMVVRQVDEVGNGHIETVELSSFKVKLSEDNVAVEDTLTINYP
jgi:hypothetical protein